MAYKQTGGIARIKNVVTDGLRYRLADARGEVLGRFAACVSRVLQGKDKPTYEPHRAEGDVVVVTNAKDIVLTGRKLEDKKYYRHTGYVGNLVTRTAKEMMEREPTFLIRKAVERMLPKNKLRKDMMRKLRVFPGETHAFDDERDESDDEEKSKTWDLMGNAYRVKGESDVAFDCFERALELKPNANSYLHYGGALRAAGDLEESVRLFGLGLELAPRHTLLRYNLGIVYAETGRLKEASTSLKAAAVCELTVRAPSMPPSAITVRVCSFSYKRIRCS